MSQENYVLRCYSCETFQVHIVKKAKKWQCKICNEKQSFMRHYGTGSGKDCRTQVMKLNELHRKKEIDQIEKECYEISCNTTCQTTEAEPLQIKTVKNSKWLQFLDDEDFLSEEELDEVETKGEETFGNEKDTHKKRKITHEAHGTSWENLDKNQWHVVDKINSGPESIHSEEVVFDVDIEVPTLHLNNFDDIKIERTKKRKYSESLHETTENRDKDSNLELKSVINHGNIFSSDPNDLDDIMNINF